MGELNRLIRYAVSGSVRTCPAEPSAVTARISQTAAWKADVNERECAISTVNACVNNNNNNTNNMYKQREL